MSSRALTLERTFIPHASVLTDVLVVAAGAALIALSEQISIPLPFTPVPKSPVAALARM